MVTIEERIKEISKKCAIELSNNYKPLTNEGKVEFMIFSSLISLFHMQTKLNEAQYENLSGKVYNTLINEIKPYKPVLSQVALGEFVNNRFQSFAGEIEMIFEGLGYNILQNSFFYLYVSPLSVTNPGLPDITQIIRFTPEIVKVANNALSQFEEIVF